MNQTTPATLGKAAGTERKSKLFSFASLFTSFGTLLCCALPSLLVLFGLGATVASVLSVAPWLVTLSQHKIWVFAIAGILIAGNFIYVYRIASRLAEGAACSPDDPTACQTATRFSRVVLWISAVIYLVGGFTAFVLGPILVWWDAHHVAMTAHIVSTVGWMGAIAAFLALAATGLTSHDDKLVGSVYLAIKLIGWKVIVPLGVGSLLTGLAQSLATPWGLFRHYWVLLKFVLTVVATVLLLLHMTLANRLAYVGNEIARSGSYLRGPRLQITADAAAAVLLLLVNTVLSVYKPRGMTLYGMRKQRQEHRVAGSDASGALELEKSASAPLWVKIFGIAAIVMLVLFRVILVHVSGGGGHHFH